MQAVWNLAASNTQSDTWEGLNSVSNTDWGLPGWEAAQYMVEDGETVAIRWNERFKVDARKKLHHEDSQTVEQATSREGLQAPSPGDFKTQLHKTPSI